MSGKDKLLAVTPTEGGGHLVSLSPSKILDELEINRIGRDIKELISNGARNLIVDFALVDHLSSSALGMLITIRDQLNSVKGSLKLCNIRPEIYQIFKITSLDRLFSIYPTTAEALEDLSDKP
jgi:anti-sigma B factor antagonist